MTNNWKDIHPNFTHNLKENWQDYGFSSQEVRDWINIGLTPHDANFVYWLEKNGYTALVVLNYADSKVLRKNYADSLNTSHPQPIHHKPSTPSWKVIIAFILTLIATYLLTN